MMFDRTRPVAQRTLQNGPSGIVGAIVVCNGPCHSLLQASAQNVSSCRLGGQEGSQDGDNVAGENLRDRLGCKVVRDKTLKNALPRTRSGIFTERRALGLTSQARSLSERRHVRSGIPSEVTLTCP